MSIQEQDIIDIYPRIMAFAFSKTRDKQKAEDLVQTTILKALENKDQWTNVKNLSAWLITICRNKFLDNVKKSTEQQFTDTSDDSNLVSNNLSGDGEVKKIFEDCSQQLDTNKKDILFMSYIKGITTKEISDIIEKPQNTILTWLANAKKQMIECIEG
jgi:RNA polymerase sigma-70 factor, ECF subfamily